MPWTTPTLRDTRRLTRDYVLSQLGAKAMIPNSVLRIMSDAMSGLANLTLLYIDWLSKQFLPDTAEQVWLDRHGEIWLKNLDGSSGRKGATYAHGEIEFAGDAATIIPIGTLLTGANNIQYQTVTAGEIGSAGLGNSNAVSLSPGAVSNLPDGDTVMVSPPLPGVVSATLQGDMTGGADTETDDQLRERILFRIQQPPMGGDANDYVAWALSVPGVTRAWAASEMGVGTITVRFMMDDLRADQGGFPNGDDVLMVEAYINRVRPVAIKDIWVLAPVPEPIDFTIKSMINDTETNRAEVEASVKEMLRQRAAPAHAINGRTVPGTTIYAAWVSEAIIECVGINSFTLIMDDHPMPYNGSLGVLGTVLYER